jgi:hypothetical protein
MITLHWGFIFAVATGILLGFEVATWLGVR